MSERRARCSCCYVHLIPCAVPREEESSSESPFSRAKDGTTGSSVEDKSGWDCYNIVEVSFGHDALVL